MSAHHFTQAEIEDALGRANIYGNGLIHELNAIIRQQQKRIEQLESHLEFATGSPGTKLTILFENWLKRRKQAKEVTNGNR